MPATSAPFGLRPHMSLPSGSGGMVARAYPNAFASGYAANIFKGSAVKLLTDGTIAVSTAGDTANLGVFAGVEYTTPTGRVYSKHWPASTAATEIVAYVYDDPKIIYEIQVDGALTQAAIGDCADFTTAADDTGSTLHGLSSATLSATLVGAAASAQFRIVGLAPYPDNAFADAFPIVLVQFNEHVFSTPVNAI